MTESYHGLDVVDYIILSTLLLISASIGVYYRFSGGKQRTTKVGQCIQHIIFMQPKSYSISGVSASRQKHVFYSCCIFFDGQFHVIYYPTWSFIRKLCIWNSVCCDQSGLHNWYTFGSIFLFTRYILWFKSMFLKKKS